MSTTAKHTDEFSVICGIPAAMTMDEIDTLFGMPSDPFADEIEESSMIDAGVCLCCRELIDDRDPHATEYVCGGCELSAHDWQNYYDIIRS